MIFLTHTVGLCVLQHATYALCRWAEEWQLTVSIEKCSVLYIGKSVPTVEVFIDGTWLPFVTSCCDLGVTVSAQT